MTRSFDQVIKSQPSSNAAHIESSIVRRRRRTFSEVIAAVSNGGFDSDMTFRPPRRDLSSSAYKPDYRGHILGEGEDVLATKIDFDSVHKSAVAGLPHPHAGNRIGRTKRPPQHKPAAARPKNPFSRTPHAAQPKAKLKKFDHIVAQRHAAKHADDDSFHKQEGQTEMNVSQDQIRRHAIENPVAAAMVHSKNDIYACIDELARAAQKPGESIEHARVTVTKSEAGAALMRAYNLAPKAAPVVQKSAPAMTREAFTKSAPGGDVVAQIDQIASKIARDEGVTLVKAKSLAWQRNPALKDAYDQASSKTRNISGGRA